MGVFTYLLGAAFVAAAYAGTTKNAPTLPELEPDFDDFPGRDYKRDVDADYPIEEYLENCGKTHRMGGRVKKVKFVSPFYGGKQYPADVKCSWSFIGNKKCQPELHCTSLELRKTDDCEDEFLKVSDGVGGVEKFCDKNDFPKGLIASQNSRDLFIEFQSSDDTKFPKKTAGVFCEVRCSKDGGKSARTLKVDKHFKKIDNRCVCGLRNEDNRIVGGEDARMNEFPWLTPLVKTGTRVPNCGGALINERYVLTAAHCFFFSKTKAEDIEVLLHARLLDQNLMSGWADVELGKKGSIQSAGYKMAKKTDEDEKTQRFKVEKIIMHPLFTTQYDYDAAILKLDRKVDLGALDAPTTICLPEPGQYNLTFEGEVPIVAGWGKGDQNAGGTTRLLQKLGVPMINTEKCQKWMPYTLTDRMMCAGFEQGEKDACTGDSGGPLMWQKKNKQFEQIGIVSWGEGCAMKHRPGIYSRVTDLLQWISYNSNDGVSKWCKSMK